MGKPRDGPATTFYPDSHLWKVNIEYRSLLDEEEYTTIPPMVTTADIGSSNNNHDHTDTTRSTSISNESIYNKCGNEFGLVVVAGWPPDEEIFQEPYSRLLSIIKQCFETNDLISNTNNKNHLPNVYLYPLQQIHMTVTTFRPFDAHPPILMHETRHYFLQACKYIVQKAFQHPLWPKSKIRLKVDGIQIGCRAGIILWKDEDESFDRMRKCILQEYENWILQKKEEDKGKEGTMRKVHEEAKDALWNYFTTPQIIHSTFLRFAATPITNGILVQERLRDSIRVDHNDGNCSNDQDDLVSSCTSIASSAATTTSTNKESAAGAKHFYTLREIFPSAVLIDSVRLVVERTPYMHIPFDDHHVVESFHFS